jgi:hypothetical protein
MPATVAYQRLVSFWQCALKARIISGSSRRAKQACQNTVWRYVATFGAAKREVPEPDDLIDAGRDTSSCRSILRGAASVMIDYEKVSPA